MNRRGSDLPLLILSLLLAMVLQLVELPDLVAALRPEWMALVVGWWAYKAPEQPVLVIAWICGLALDVLFNNLLGQHALALLTVAFLVRRLRGTLAMLSPLQVSLALAPVWVLYAFLMFWIDGLSHHNTIPSLRWLPAAGTCAAWPLCAALLGRLRSKQQPQRLH